MRRRWRRIGNLVENTSESDPTNNQQWHQEACERSFGIDAAAKDAEKEETERRAWKFEKCIFGQVCGAGAQAILDRWSRQSQKISVGGSGNLCSRSTDMICWPSELYK